MYVNYKFKFSVFIINILLATAHANTYTQKDLDALSLSGDYKEYMAHAGDIRPSNRNKLWQQQVSKNALSRIKEINQKPKVLKSHLQELNSYKKWKFLSDSHFYKLELFKFYTNYLHICPSQYTSSHCSQVIISIINDFNYSPHFAETFIKLINKNYSNIEQTYNLNSLYRTLGHSKLSDVYCSRPYFQNYFTKKIMTLNEKKSQEFRENTLNQACFKVIKENVQDTLLHSEISEKTNRAFLNLRKEWDANFSYAYQVKYLLNLPKVGPLFNYSWNSALKLSESHKLRLSILKELSSKKIQTYIFTHPETQFVTSIYKHLNQNFPELVNVLQQKENCSMNYYCEDMKKFIMKYSQDSLNSTMSSVQK